jgi:hypothetical protein
VDGQLKCRIERVAAEVEFKEPILAINYGPTTSYYVVKKVRVTVNLNAEPVNVNEFIEELRAKRNAQK